MRKLNKNQLAILAKYPQATMFTDLPTNEMASLLKNDYETIIQDINRVLYDNWVNSKYRTKLMEW